MKGSLAVLALSVASSLQEPSDELQMGEVAEVVFRSGEAGSAGVRSFQGKLSTDFYGELFAWAVGDELDLALRVTDEDGLVQAEDDPERGVAPSPLAYDCFKHLPHVLLGLKILLAIAATVNPFDQTPLDQLAQIHAGAAARHGQLFHDVVGAERFGGHVQQGMNLGHRAADAPARRHFAPTAYKEISGRLNWFFLHGSSFQ